MATDQTEPFKSVQELDNANLDRTVDPLTRVIGVMGKNGSQAWEYISSNQNHLLVSGTFAATATTSPLSADSSKVSAIQGDAGLLHVSAFVGDAGTFRVSAIGGTAGDRTLVDGTTQTISATLTPISTSPATTTAGLVVNSYAPDAGKFRVSAIGGTAGDHTIVDGTTQTISATFTPISTSPAETVAGLVVNTFQDDADELHVSAIIGQSLSATAQNFIVSAVAGDAGTFHTSAFVDSGSISARSGDANQMHVSTVQGDAGLLHVSVVGTLTVNTQATVSAFINQGTVSAYSPDASLFRVSGIGTFTTNGISANQQLSAVLLGGTANIGDVSAVQGDSGQLHVSASIFPDTTGGLTIFSNFNVSTSQNIKSTGGAVYGWYAWNMDKNPAYINLYNTSGATNVGVDTIQVQIALAASAAANVFTPIGLKGFTAGISVAAVSGAVSTSNSPPAASAVGINLFYK